jgi:hypothetical protein
MKKLAIGTFVLLLVLVFLALVYLKRPVVLGDSVSPGLVPGDAVAFVQIPDLQRTRERWGHTALYQIVHEPEVQAFLAKPKSKLPQDQHLQDDWDKFHKIDPKEGFLAVTAVTDKLPKFVAGFDYKGAKNDAADLANEWKEKLKSAYPSGKSDIVQYDSGEIETFQFEGNTVATTFRNHWFFVADDVDLLKATLDRLAGKGSGPVLRDDADYKSSVAKLPAESDGVLFIQPKTLVDRFVTLIAISDPAIDTKQLDEWKKVQAVSAGVKLDGEKIRDAVFIKEPIAAGAPAMARNSFAFTTPDTLLYFATLLHLDTAPRLPDPALDNTGVLAAIQLLVQSVQSKGLTYDDFKSTFGPEFGLVVDWPGGVIQPSPLFALDVRDAAKAGKFVDALTDGSSGLSAWGKQVIDGVPYYALPQESAGLIAVNPVVAITDKALLFGLSLDSVQQAVQNGKSATPKIDKSAGFQASSALVGKPAGAFGYIDSKALFEKVYGVASSTLKVMAVFNPHASDYADLSKLPSTEAISKHLSPIVYSQSTDADGVLVESVGPVTFNEAAFAVGLGGALAVGIKAHAQSH